jgi:hypothetical protein
MNELARIPTASLVGATALAFSALYLLSDVIEAFRAASRTASSG